MRIIAGRFGGRRIAAPRGHRTRPTTDRVREAWFSMLGPLSGRVLDLYAGTGALGLESLSRGAEHATFVESWKEAARSIASNAESLGISDSITLLERPVERAIQEIKNQGPYNLILTDPPWTTFDACERTLASLLTENLLGSEGRLVVGHPKGRPVRLPDATGLAVQTQRHWGDSAATFYVRASGQGSV